MTKHIHKPLALRLLYLIIGCFQNITTGGVLYGWSSISGSLLLAIPSEGGPGLNHDFIHVMFVTAVFFSFLGPLVLGALLDSYGPRICSLVSLFFVAAGSLLFAMSDTPHLPMFIPALSMVAFGGPGAQSAIIHLSNLFPTAKATATACITGSLNLSFIVFFAFDQLWHFLLFDYHTLFFGYSLLVVFNMVLSLLLWPDEAFSFEEQILPSTDDLSALERMAEEIDKVPVGLIRLPSKMVRHDPNTGVLRGSATSPPAMSTKAALKQASFREQLLSQEFVSLTVFFVVTSFWANFFVGTLDLQLGDSALMLTPYEQRFYGRLLSVVMAGAFVAIPIVGVMMDKWGFTMTSVAIVALGLLWSLLLLYDEREVLIPSFVFYALFRTFLFTFLFAYMADSLGFKYFGILAGIMFVLAGFIGLLQYPLASWATGDCHLANNAVKRLHCNHGHWAFINLAMVLCMVGTLGFCYVDWVRRRRLTASTSRLVSMTRSGRGPPPVPSLKVRSDIAVLKAGHDALASRSGSDKEAAVPLLDKRSPPPIKTNLVPVQPQSDYGSSGAASAGTGGSVQAAPPLKTHGPGAATARATMTASAQRPLPPMPSS